MTGTRHRHHARSHSEPRCLDADLLDEITLLTIRTGREIRTQRRRRGNADTGGFAGLAVSDTEVQRALRALRRDEPAPASGRPRRLEQRILRHRARSDSNGPVSRLTLLSERLGLRRHHERCLVAALAPEFDRRWERVWGFLHDDLTRSRLSVDLLVRLCGETADERADLWRELAGSSPLLSEHLLVLGDQDPTAPLATRSVKLDDRIVRFLVGDIGGDDALSIAIVGESAEGPAHFRSWWPQGLESWAEGFSGNSASVPPPIGCLHGAVGAGMLEAAVAISGKVGRPLLQLDIAAALQGALPWADFRWRVRREVKLSGAIACFHVPETRPTEEGGGAWQRNVEQLALDLPGPVLLLARKPWKIVGSAAAEQVAGWPFELPPVAARERLWEQHLNGDLSVELRPALADLAGMFRVTPGQIRTATALARQSAARRDVESAAVTVSDLAQACFAQTNERLDGLARRLQTPRDWSALVLPDTALAQLRALSAHVRFREQVYGQWGFGPRGSRGRGLSALFYGVSGTGKTLAAEVIAHELELPLYRINLASVVSKYIGQTEKNLEQIFTEAEAANAILLFDEADALFGKRSEVKDAHDRYANIEIGYLLQRMEDFDGISILTTNLRRNLDDAFVRRLQFIVEFPFPDETSRLRIWRTHLPPEAPRDENLDLEFFARQFKLSGGHIRNVAIGAAFAAAAAGTPIGTAHLAQATFLEFQKIGRTCTTAEFGPHAGLVDGIAPRGIPSGKEAVR